MTLKYAVFHPEYSDVAPHFDRTGQMLGPYEAEEEDVPGELVGGSLGDPPSGGGRNAGVEK